MYEWCGYQNIKQHFPNWSTQTPEGHEPYSNADEKFGLMQTFRTLMKFIHDQSR